ncbi:MAG: hypothetical protein N2235_19210 [Fischerella sp.]|nr:hypothetical protein [Fischerella sp.]
MHTNAYPAIHALTVKVQTAAIPIERRESIFYASLIWAFLTGEIATVTVIGVISWIFATLASHNIVFCNMPSITDGSSGALVFGTVGAIAGTVGGAVIGGICYFFEKNKQRSESSSPYSYNYRSEFITSFFI